MGGILRKLICLKALLVIAAATVKRSLLNVIDRSTSRFPDPSANPIHP